MKRNVMSMALGLALLTLALPAAHARTCGPDAVPVGAVCLDRYEASVWRVPNPNTTNAPLVAKIQLGTVTRADLTVAGATQLGTLGDDYAPCSHDGQSCVDDIYAVSLPALFPSADITWFQAQEACANAGKRLPTSAEWQLGATGTPDAGADNGTTNCNSNTGSATLTGARTDCQSARGALDMVGNLSEWVADWVPLSTACSSWGAFSDDWMCLTGASTTDVGPGALIRGGDFRSRTSAGPLAVIGSGGPFSSRNFIGFRCAR
ncbi:MAG TPA: SUMF1/EgtB/PvdO family nonheme iron enzyme [Candidatus Polarisedimenticolaceae bacterium]|nr:SUMF1/EgtB/PvdO family nonheme iron enzyme [Candidatus Polarisedimenticolaceae bacterium]